jgi:hypothetical protein
VIFALLSVCVAWSTNFLELGDSNARGTIRDTLKGGQPVPLGYRFFDSGVEQTTWPNTHNPSVGKLPYLVDLAVADGETTGWIVRRGTYGATLNWPGVLEGQWLGAIHDVSQLGGEPDVVILTYGANDGRTEAQALEFEENGEYIVSLIQSEWEYATIVWAKEGTSASGALGTYRYLEPIVYPSIEVIDLTHENVVTADGSQCERADEIHWSPVARGRHGGQRCVAQAIYAVVFP